MRRPSEPAHATARLMLLLVLFFLLLSLSESRSCTVKAVFAFGDSTVDSGNNNFLPTAFRSNFPPYGRDFFDHTPTGRFSNGKLPDDFVGPVWLLDWTELSWGTPVYPSFQPSQSSSQFTMHKVSYLGLKEHLPPYLDLSLGLEELLTGVSFASAGSGYDLLTSQLSGVIPVPLQLGFFRTYQARLLLMIGEKKTQDLIRESIFLVSAGTNDFVANYFPLPIRKKDFNAQQYQTFIIHKIRDFLQELVDMGAQKIAIAGLPPMGCLPIVITLNWAGRFQERGCIDYYNSIAREFNAKLQAELQSSFRYSTANISYADIYSPVMDVISSPSRFGFEETMSGCCGTGLLEASLLCNLKSLVCPDASKYVFWDSIHPTEKMYQIVFNALQPSIDAIC